MAKTFCKAASLSASVVAMTYDASGNCREDFLQFRCSQVENSFCLRFSIFFVVNSSCQTFYEAFTCLIRNYVTNIFKTARHVEQNKENKLPVRSSMCLDSKRSWATTNHNTRSIQIIVSRIISLFRSMNQCIHHSTLLNVA